MKKLCAVRHASYNFETGHLNDYGKREAIVLANSLASALGVVQATIVSSDIIRARETADFIAEKFGAPVATHRFLSLDENSRERAMFKLSKLVKMYEKEGAEDLIFVTHEMQATFLPGYFAKERFGLDWDDPTIDKGTGWIIDCENKTLKLVP